MCVCVCVRTDRCDLIKIYIYVYMYMLWSVNIFGIFWSFETQFSRSGYFCPGPEHDQPHSAIRCRAQVRLTRFAFIARNCFKIHAFRSTWPRLILEVLATWAKFLQPSGYFTVIKFTFIFCATNVFAYFRGVMLQLRLMFLCGAFKLHTVWSNHSEYLSQLELLQSRDIRATN